MVKDDLTQTRLGLKGLLCLARTAIGSGNARRTTPINLSLGYDWRLPHKWIGPRLMPTSSPRGSGANRYFRYSVIERKRDASF